MNCERIEELLTRYVEGDLAADERRMVDEHLAACERCSLSLELFSSLEASLIARKAEIPSAGASSRRIMKRLRRDEGYTFICSPWGAPVLIGSVVLLSVILTVVFGRLLAQPSPSESGTLFVRIERFFAHIPDLIVGALGGEYWLIITVYVALALCFAAAGSLTVLRYSRE
jgi:hypothetical protein